MKNFQKVLLAGGVFCATLFNMNLNVDTNKSSLLDMVTLSATTASASCVETSTGQAGRCSGGSCSSSASTGSYCTV